jgi:anaerobic selenocysteine-containing dehydrogenase
VPVLDALVAPSPLRVNGEDLAALGVAAGDEVRLRAGSTDMVVTVVPDPSLPRGVAAADFNVPLQARSDGAAAVTVADLIDVTSSPVVDVRIEAP